LSSNVLGAQLISHQEGNVSVFIGSLKAGNISYVDEVIFQALADHEKYADGWYNNYRACYQDDKLFRLHDPVIFTHYTVERMGFITELILLKCLNGEELRLVRLDTFSFGNVLYTMVSVLI